MTPILVKNKTFFTNFVDFSGLELQLYERGCFFQIDAFCYYSALPLLFAELTNYDRLFEMPGWYDKATVRHRCIFLF